MPTFTQIGTAQVVGSGGAASVTFSSIPSTYTDLCIKVSLRAVDAAAGNITFAINGSTSNLSSRFVYGDGNTVASGSTTSNYQGIVPGSNYTSNTFGNGEIYFANYANSTNKSFMSDAVTENNSAQSYTIFSAALWAQTAAITSIAIGATNGNLVQHSTAYLYGVSNA
jgi:hypothetical protein